MEARAALKETLQDTALHKSTSRLQSDTRKDEVEALIPDSKIAFSHATVVEVSQ